VAEIILFQFQTWLLRVK